MINDYDWEILDKRLKALEDSLEMLKAVFTVKDSTSDVDYVLYQGDLTDAGSIQVWGNNHKLVDCISTTRLED